LVDNKFVHPLSFQRYRIFLTKKNFSFYRLLILLTVLIAKKMNGEKNAIMVNYSDKELAAGVARELKSFITDHVNQILNEKAEDEETPMSMSEAALWLGISRTTLSKLVGKGEVSFKSFNPDNPKAKKVFTKKDLREWLLKNKSKTIDELKAVGYGSKS
jgi:hypothetical protein